MKKLCAIAVMAMFLCSFSLANAEVPVTGRGDYTTPIAPLTTWLNENDMFYHSHEYEQTSKYKSPLGYMLDVTLYKMDISGIPCAVGLQGQYDQNNAVWGCFGKVSVDLSGMIKGLIGQ